MTKQKITSEYGKGFIYNLILFSKHFFQWHETFQKEGGQFENFSLWFNGASDHFYEFEIPEKFRGTEIGELAEWLQKWSLYWGHGFQEKATEEDFLLTFEKLERLAILLDKALGIDDIKADYT
jgi:hypothetical protein